MLHARHNLITADPSQLSDSVKFIENEVRRPNARYSNLIERLAATGANLGIPVLVESRTFAAEDQDADGRL